MKKIMNIILLLILANVFVLSAASTDGASLQIDSYSTVPNILYPGTSGQLQLNIVNKGAYNAENIQVIYTYGSLTTPSTIRVGSIAAGSGTITSIPIDIPLTVKNGFYNIELQIYYYDSSSSSSGYKTTNINVPLEINQKKALDISYILENQNVFQGDKINVELTFNNDEGKINNLIVTSIENSSILINGKNQVRVGNIENEKIVNITLQSTSDISTGAIQIPLRITYENSLGETIQETIYLGPINIIKKTNILRVELNPTETVEIGSNVNFELSVTNLGANVESAIITLGSSNIFIPLGSSRIYFDDINPGEKLIKNVSIGISSSSSSGYYILDAEIEQSDGETAKENFGLFVEATPKITVDGSISTSNKLEIQISNTGNTAIRSVYLTVGTEKEFVGTLNVDDYYTYESKETYNKGNEIEVELIYRDGNNMERILAQTIKLNENSGVQFINKTNGTEDNMMMGGPEGFNRTRNNQGITFFGIDIIYVVGLIVIVVGGFFLNKKFKFIRGNKNESN